MIKFWLIVSFIISAFSWYFWEVNMTMHYSKQLMIDVSSSEGKNPDIFCLVFAPQGRGWFFSVWNKCSLSTTEGGNREYEMHLLHVWSLGL
jgi:hypothetical protein